MINEEIISFANHLADISGEIVKKYFRKSFGEVLKSDQSPVTLADREIEERIREEILKRFPDHGIIGEEFGSVNSDSKYQWIIDPIDGTISFTMGRPIFGSLIALCENQKPIFGIINQPITGERWVGSNVGTFFNGKKTQTRKCENLSDAILCSTSPHFFKDKDLEKLNKISSKAKYQNQGGVIYGGDCYLFGLLSLGQIDIVIENGLNNFDFSALVPIVKNAGGVITDWNGKELTVNSDGKVLACGDIKLHEKILKLIA